jgi:WD40 repeat protein
MVTAKPGEHGRPRKFPVLDAEPPRRPWRVRAIVLAVVAGAVAAGVALWSVSSGGSRLAGAAGQPASLAARAGGRILALTPTGSLVLTDPGGTHVTMVRALGVVGQVVTASPDGRYLSLGNGQVAVVRTGPVLASYPTKTSVSWEKIPAWPDSFADHERQLVMLLSYGADALATNPVFLTSLATGRSVSLGVGDQVAGDPRTAGAFLSVAAPPRPSAAVTHFSPDSRIELRDAGRPPVTLATAAALNHDLGQSQQLSVQLIPYPDQSGDQIAVIVQPTAGSQQAGIVVLTRAGRVIGTVPARLGVRGTPAWAPSGGSLAYSSNGSNGPELRVWKIGGPIGTRPFPGSDGTYSWCIWSPDGASILCAAPGVGTGSQNWAVTGAAGGAMAGVRGPGFPVAWLP